MQEAEYRLKKDNILDAYGLQLLTYIEARDALILLDTRMIQQRLREVSEKAILGTGEVAPSGFIKTE